MSQPDPHAAIVERREQIAAEPRPTRVAEQVDVEESGDLWRVYHYEWVTTYVTEDDDGAEARIQKYYLDNLAGRVRHEDWQVVAEGDFPYVALQVQVRRPNMRAEFKHLPDAEKFVSEQGWEGQASIVQRNSHADHDLRSYGTKRLTLS
jgi:hypothetical protein